MFRISITRTGSLLVGLSALMGWLSGAVLVSSSCCKTSSGLSVSSVLAVCPHLFLQNRFLCAPQTEGYPQGEGGVVLCR
jgi:hypothetical protein